MMNVFNFSKLTMIAAVSAMTMSMSAQAQLADDGSTELLFSKAATAHSTGPKCDIEFSRDELPIVAGMHAHREGGEKRQRVWLDPEGNDLVVKVDFAEIAQLRITASTEFFEHHPDKGTLVHRVTSAQTGIEAPNRAPGTALWGAWFSTKKWIQPPEAVFELGREYRRTPDDFTMNGTDEFVIESIEYQLARGDNLDEDSDLEGHMNFTCYSL